MNKSESAGIEIGHAVQARKEMKILSHGFCALAAGTSVATPAIDRLYAYIDPSKEPVADESPKQTAPQWSGSSALAVLAALISVVWRAVA